MTSPLTTDAVSVPANYDKYLGPFLFEPYAIVTTGVDFKVWGIQPQNSIAGMGLQRCKSVSGIHFTANTSNISMTGSFAKSVWALTISAAAT